MLALIRLFDRRLLIGKIGLKGQMDFRKISYPLELVSKTEIDEHDPSKNKITFSPVIIGKNGLVEKETFVSSSSIVEITPIKAEDSSFFFTFYKTIMKDLIVDFDSFISGGYYKEKEDSENENR